MESPQTTKRLSLRPSGFTLIEMLVVIAIIGILAAMMMPLLQKAIQASKALFCVNNLKNIGQTFFQYSGDYNGYLPSARFSSGTGGQWRPTLGVLGYMCSYESGKNSRSDIAYCPKTTEQVYLTDNNTYGVPTGRSSVGSLCFSSGSTNYYCARANLLNASKHVLVADSRRGWLLEDTNYMDGSFYIDNGSGAEVNVSSTLKVLSLRHSGMFNAVFPDLSAGSKSVNWVEESNQYSYSPN